MNKFLLPAVLVIILIGGVSVYATAKKDDDSAMMKKDVQSTATASATASDEAMKMHEKEVEAMAMTKDAGATFIDFKTEADAQALVADHEKDVVYFFDASWCPDCQAIQKKLENADDLAKLGKNTVIVKVDYDKEKALKAKYNITHQTAFVRIDGTGKALKSGILSEYSDVLTF